MIAREYGISSIDVASRFLLYQCDLVEMPPRPRFRLARKTEFLRFCIQNYPPDARNHNSKWVAFWAIVRRTRPGIEGTSHEDQDPQKLIFAEWKIWYEERHGHRQVRVGHHDGSEYHNLMKRWHDLQRKRSEYKVWRSRTLARWKAEEQADKAPKEIPAQRNAPVVKMRQEKDQISAPGEIEADRERDRDMSELRSSVARELGDVDYERVPEADEMLIDDGLGPAQGAAGQLDGSLEEGDNLPDGERLGNAESPAGGVGKGSAAEIVERRNEDVARGVKAGESDNVVVGGDLDVMEEEDVDEEDDVVEVEPWDSAEGEGEPDVEGHVDHEASDIDAERDQRTASGSSGDQTSTPRKRRRTSSTSYYAPGALVAEWREFKKQRYAVKDTSEPSEEGDYINGPHSNDTEAEQHVEDMVQGVSAAHARQAIIDAHGPVSSTAPSAQDAILDDEAHPKPSAHSPPPPADDTTQVHTEAMDIPPRPHSAEAAEVRESSESVSYSPPSSPQPILSEPQIKTAQSTPSSASDKRHVNLRERAGAPRIDKITETREHALLSDALSTAVSKNAAFARFASQLDHLNQRLGCSDNMTQQDEGDGELAELMPQVILNAAKAAIAAPDAVRSCGAFVQDVALILRSLRPAKTSSEVVDEMVMRR